MQKKGNVGGNGRIQSSIYLRASRAFKEFYIFPSAPPQLEFAVFADYDRFTLGPAIAGKVQANSRWDLRRVQRIFWQLLEEAAPESYLACGSRLIFVTRKAAYFSCVLKG